MCYAASKWHRTLWQPWLKPTAATKHRKHHCHHCLVARSGNHISSPEIQIHAYCGYCSDWALPVIKDASKYILSILKIISNVIFWYLGRLPEEMRIVFSQGGPQLFASISQGEIMVLDLTISKKVIGIGPRTVKFISKNARN